jgi:hypothetical protein
MENGSNRVLQSSAAQVRWLMPLKCNRTRIHCQAFSQGDLCKKRNSTRRAKTKKAKTKESNYNNNNKKNNEDKDYDNDEDDDKGQRGCAPTTRAPFRRTKNDNKKIKGLPVEPAKQAEGQSGNGKLQVGAELRRKNRRGENLYCVETSTA